MPVNPCCGGCVTGLLACPAGMAGSYVVTPPALNFGTNVAGRTISGCLDYTPDGVITVTGSCTPRWIAGAIVVSGRRTADYDGSGLPITLANTQSIVTGSTTCSVWQVRLKFATLVVPCVGEVTFVFEKFRTGAAINDITGTYTLAAILDDATGTCSVPSGNLTVS